MLYTLGTNYHLPLKKSHSLVLVASLIISLGQEFCELFVEPYEY